MKRRRIILEIIISLFLITCGNIVFKNNTKALSINVEQDEQKFIIDETNKIFGDIEIEHMTYLYNLNDSPDYIYVDFKGLGYVIYYRDTLEIMEYSYDKDIDYSSYALRKYYVGPFNYYEKRNNQFVNIDTGCCLNMSEFDIEVYANSLSSLFSKNINERSKCFLVKKRDTNYDFVNTFPKNRDPEIDILNLITANTPGSPNTTYIDNYAYFLSDPTYGFNRHGTCGSVAAQLLLGYNNYYNDRRIIDVEYLNGDWTGIVSSDLYDKHNYLNPNDNINVCDNPMSLTRYTTGTNDDFYEYIIQSIEPSAFNCICTETQVEISGGIATVTTTIYYPDGTNSTSVVTRAAEPDETDSVNTIHTHSGSSIYDVVDGLESILSEKLNNNQYNITYDIKGSFFGWSPISSIPIKNEIDAGRPLIIGMNSNLGGNNHWVVGYGYQDYIYPGGTETYSGYIVNYGWTNQYNIWINESWCNSYIKLQINHTHNYNIVTNNIIDGSQIELRCGECGHRKLFNLFNLSNNAIVGLNYPISGSITIPSTINSFPILSIGNQAFKNCTGLTSITLPNTIASIGDSAFEGCTNLSSITLPNTITSIGNSAFKGCSSLSSINIPSSVTTINQSVFENCSSLSSITLPSTITTIGTSAFKGCSSLSSITIGQNVYSIGDYAFMNCTSLSNVTIGRDITNITSLGTSAFNNCSSSLSIKVPINRLAQYKNETNWHFYGTNITSNPLTFDEININCLSSNESRTVTLDQYKRKLYKINVSCNANYQVQVTGLVRTNLYDSDMEYISTNFNTFYLNLSSGVYYIDMEYDYQEFGSVTISFSSINYPGNDIYFGSNNCLTHLHPVDSSFSLNKLRYNNTQGVGFYKFTLTGEKTDLTPLLYYDGAITLYNNEARTQIIDRLDISNYSYDSFTNQGENSMWVYLPRNGYFYIDINMPTANYLNLSLTISSPTTQEVNIFDMPNIMSYQNITLMTSIDERSDYVKEIEVKQAGVFNIACSYSGLQSSNVDLFLITKDDLDIIYITTLSSNNTYRSSFVLLEEGVYYLGYFDLNVGSITDVHLNRYIDDESSEVYNTLITDPSIYSCGSEITILEEGLVSKSFYSNIITVGFTRLIYLDSNYCNYSLSRLDYYWYSSDSSKARVTSYGTVLGVDDTDYNETVTILAVLKSDPSIIYVKDFIIREDSGVGSIVVYNNYSIKYSDTNNGVFHLHLESITTPYPMYTYYIWTTSNESSGLIVSNDNWGNYTVNTYGSFTLTATDYIYNDRITIYINVTITNN